MLKQLKVLFFLSVVCLFLGTSMNAYAADDNQISNDQLEQMSLEDQESNDDLIEESLMEPQFVVTDENKVLEAETEAPLETSEEVIANEQLERELVKSSSEKDEKPEVIENKQLDRELVESSSEKDETAKKPYKYKSGWNHVNGVWFYGNQDGTAKTGWLKSGDKWYYLKTTEEDPDTPGSMVANCAYCINNTIYGFYSTGAMKTGWQKENNNWFYYKNNGARVIGKWLEDKGIWYYLTSKTESIDSSGVMARNCQRQVKSSIYSFYSTGAMKTGWQKENNNWFYYKANGARMLGAWFQDKGIWYYLTPKTDSINNSGVMECGTERNIGGKTYRFRTDGSMHRGWFHAKEGWYYYRTSGAKVLGGFEKIANQYYYFLHNTEDSDYSGRMFNGDMLAINGKKHYFEPKGNTYNKWYYNKAWYYYDVYGAMYTGWLNAGSGNWYYLYPKDRGPEGVMATNKTIDGYYVARNGVYNKTYQKAYNILNRIGWTIRAAFNYASTLPYQTFSTDGGLGSLYFADYGFSNGRGNCYVMAATFYVMATLLGEEVHQISGAVPLRSGGMGPHSWVETIWKGTLYVCDPNFSYYGNNGYYIRYGQKGTWRYSNYYRMN